MAPTVVRDGPFRLFFFSREEPPIHVHVAHPDGEAKFCLTPSVHLAMNIVSPRPSCAKRKRSSNTTVRRSKMPGTATLDAEVTHISRHGFWILLGEDELAVPFAKFPWFKQATIEQITAVERPTSNHLYWPQPDVDLTVESLRDPEAYPLVSRPQSTA